MAHLHRCRCGRLFRCEGVRHAAPAWYWCEFKACPDRSHHGFSLADHLIAQQRRLETQAERGPIYIDASFVWSPVTRERSLRCRAQGPREHGGS